MLASQPGAVGLCSILRRCPAGASQSSVPQPITGGGLWCGPVMLCKPLQLVVHFARGPQLVVYSDTAVN